MSHAPLRLSIAAAIAFPDGSMTESGLRKEAAKGHLVIERVAGKLYTTLADIERMREICRVEAKARVAKRSITRRDDSPASGSEEEEAESALAAAMTIMELVPALGPFAPDQPMTTDDAQKVWRYMPLSRFLWLLQNERFWLSRIDQLDDEWEMALAGNQLAYVISRRPIPSFDDALAERETATDRSKRIFTLWRETTLVSCWSASHEEAHALWRIYCGPKEGIAIQTTFGRLRKSVGDLLICPIDYETPGTKMTPSSIDLVTVKRPMFEYEHEIRIVYFADTKVAETCLVTLSNGMLKRLSSKSGFQRRTCRSRRPYQQPSRIMRPG
jgi:hypothetical protein